MSSQRMILLTCTAERIFVLAPSLRPEEGQYLQLGQFLKQSGITVDWTLCFKPTEKGGWGWTYYSVLQNLCKGMDNRVLHNHCKCMDKG